MSRSLLALVACATLMGLAGCAGPLAREEFSPVFPEQIVAMARAGETTAAIITRIQQSDTVYSLTASQFVQLSKDGVHCRCADYPHRDQAHRIADLRRRRLR